MASILCGARANWLLHPPSTPSALMIFMLAVRSIWCSRSVRVWVGAITMLSPVCTPIGSIFSILHTVMQLSLPSRIISYSISFQPTKLFSISTWCTGLTARPLAATALNVSIVEACPPPVPPSVKAGRTTTGRPIVSAAAKASFISVAIMLSGTGSPISSSIFLNRSRSSALRMVSIGVPSERTLYLSRTPASARSTAILSPVCPPSVGSKPSGRSFAMIRSMTSTVSGSI